MKKIFVSIGVLLTVSSAFSQPYGGILSYFTERPAYEFRGNAFSWITNNGVSTYTLTPQKFKAMLGNEQFLKVIDKETYSFFNEGKFYMLSYDRDTLDIPNLKWRNNMRIERGLYLFRLDDSGWVRASDKPLQMDFKEIMDSKWNYSAYFPWRYDIDLPKDADDKQFTGMVNILGNGDVFIRMINHKMTNYSDPNSKIKYFYTEVILTPKGDGTYSVQ